MKLLRFLGGCFIDDFDVLKQYLHRLPAKATTVSGSQFWKNKQTNCLPWRNAGGGKNPFNSRHLRVSN